MMNEHNYRILFASPVHQKPAILNEFLESLLHLKQKRNEVHYYFIDDNMDQSSSKLLQQFQLNNENTRIIPSETQDNYECNDTTHYWNSHLIWKVAALKNKMIHYAIEKEYDYLFLVDSDLILHPDTIIQLLSADKPIVSEIFWTQWTPNGVLQPQVWLYDEYTQWEQLSNDVLVSEEEQLLRYHQFIDKMNRPGLYEVGGLGACTLIRRDALLAGVSYDRIPNISFAGEDRHFCIRAAVLGIPLYVDTHYPALHLYRESDLKHYLTSKEQRISNSDQHNLIHDVNNNYATISIREHPKLTLTMVIRNEASRYLKQVLREHRKYIHEAVIIDDASTDQSQDICRQILNGIPLHIIRNEQSMFSNELVLRQQQWKETLQTNPDWILNLDADEQFENRFADQILDMLKADHIDCYCFRLFDLWNDTHYREDQYWHAHLYYRPFLVRYRDDFQAVWRDAPQHVGRFPLNILELKHQLSPLRLKHYGWARHEHRLDKFNRYMKLDPKAKYGWKEQYHSILDEHPILLPWLE